jgi:heme exporter protein A
VKTVNATRALALELQGLRKSYGPIRVLDDISFQVGVGDAVGLVGPNGAGKSTLLRILAGLSRPTAGRVLLCGREGRDPQVRRSLGYVSHEPLVYPQLSASENLLFYADMYALPDARRRVGSLLEEVGLDWTGSRRVVAFSRGMVQRLTLARALLHEPDILLLDEPHTGLDPDAAQGLGRILQRFRDEGGTILLATHEFHRIPGLVDRVLVLHLGRIRASKDVERSGPIEELVAFYQGALSGER